MLPPPAAALMEDVVEEILLRFPPNKPALLFRAALVCKHWLRLVSTARFRRRLCEHHRTPPMLGCFCANSGLFTPVTASPFSSPPVVVTTPTGSTWRHVDALHGRVLFYYDKGASPETPFQGFSETTDLVVWNSVDGEVRRIPRLPPPLLPASGRWSAAALACAAPGCDHLDCGGDGPFQVLLVATVTSSTTTTCVYSSEHDAWSDPVTVQLGRRHGDCILRGPAARARNALYFIWKTRMSQVHSDRILEYVWGEKHINTVLEYDTGKQELSSVSLPPACEDLYIALVTLGDGTLGFTTVVEYKLYIWAREPDDDLDGEATWSQRRVIDLIVLLPALALGVPPRAVAIVNSVGVTFVATSDGCFSVDLKSGRARRLGDFDIVPFTMFCTPGTNIIRHWAAHGRASGLETWDQTVLASAFETLAL